jgi:hypothetical protein
VSFTTCRTADGTRCADAEYVGCDHHLTSKGWWANRFDAQIIFYDPANLASVASGAMESHVPQPYAALDIDEHLYLPAPTGDVVDVYGSGDQRKHRVVAVAYDRARNFLYVMEGFADGAKPVIHVWRIAD